ncbi:MAG: hypothetical protein ACFFDT_33630 [Candidatus Hodarchaeota archaeon]
MLSDSSNHSSQILSFLIIDVGAKNKTIVERNYMLDSDSETNLSLFGGFIAAVAHLCEDVAQDEVRAIQLGATHIIVLRFNGFLFTLHAGFGASHFTTMAKLKRIRDTLLDKYGAYLTTRLTTNPLPEYLLSEIDKIIFEHTAIDFEQILDYFLTGENIIGAELRNMDTNEVLFTHSRTDNSELILYNSVLIQIFLLIASQGGLPTDFNTVQNCILFKLSGKWICGIQEQNILLVSLFDEGVDQRVIHDIVYGKLGEILTFVAQYFQALI